VGLDTTSHANVVQHSLKSTIGEITPKDYASMSDEVSRAPQVIDAFMKNPALMQKYGVRDEEGVKRLIMQRLIDKYGINYASKIKTALGIKSSLDDFAAAIAANVGAQ
jgi:hypothetical protein